MNTVLRDFVFCLSVLGSISCAPPPTDVLWAWERPEDLRFLDPRTLVAPLVATVDLAGAAVSVRGRRQPLWTTESTPLVAVVRIEYAGAAPTWSAKQRSEIVDAVLGPWIDDADELQIDFDALRSDRAAYAALLHDVRARLPTDVRLTITALASWCLGDRWFGDLPIDDAVPMLFRMGRDAERVRTHLEDDDWSESLCRRSFGLSTDEPWPAIVERTPNRRRYLFHPEPWTAQAYAEIRR